MALQGFVDKVGPVVSAAWLNGVDSFVNGGQPVAPGIARVRYTQAQTPKSTTIVLADDPYLVFPAVPAGTYMVKGFLQFQGSVTGAQGFQWKILVVGGITGNNWLTSYGVANNTAVPPALATTIQSVQQYGTIQTALTDFVNFEGVVTTGAAGNISLQWAQKNSNANATLLNDRSWMTVTPLA